MTYINSTFNGDAEFSVNCTGDACTGDIVRFERAIFGGSLRNPKFLGFELVTGEIVKDSYGVSKQQHTFTILQTNGHKLIIKGRNVYKNGCFRQPWNDEAERQRVLDEKHERGDRARADRDARRADVYENGPAWAR